MGSQVVKNKTQDDLVNVFKEYIRDVPNFPKPGIIFRDITPLLQEATVFKKAIQVLAERLDKNKVDAIVAIESRGLIFGSALAYELGVGLVLVRKQGKLPHKTFQATYTLEYGTDTLEIHQDALKAGSHVWLVDDLLATGGTMEATVNLVKQCGASITGFAFLIELLGLSGRKRLDDCDVVTLLQYD